MLKSTSLKIFFTRSAQFSRAFSNKKLAFSGIQPTGALHLGNYLGALKQWVDNQDMHDNMYCVVDLHAITTSSAHKKSNNLYEDTLKTAAIYLAAGIDPNKSKIFIQSHVSAHAELTWLFNCVTPLNWIERMSQYKDKSANTTDVSVGLLSYPILMAADILLYQPHFVPVGDDQKQHLNVARDIAGRFNSLYKVKYFKTLPEPLVVKHSGSRVMSLTDGTKKMSKSEENDMSRINLLDPVDVIVKKIKRCKTDHVKGLDISGTTEETRNRPECVNLLNIYQTLSGKSMKDVEAEYVDSNWSVFKPNLIDVVVSNLKPIQENYQELMKNKDYLEQVLMDGGNQANVIANQSLSDIKQIMGFYPPIAK